jgi:hypothetical protein
MVYFTASDADGVLLPSNIVPTVKNTIDNLQFYSPSGVQIDACGAEDIGCPQDGTGFKITLSPANHGDGAATVTLTATDAESLQGATSFTLRKNSNAAYPPLIANIPNESIELSQFAYGPVQVVIDDMNESGVNDAIDANGNSTVQMPTAVSDNEDVVHSEQIQFTQLAGEGRTWIMNAHPTGVVSGRAVITVTAMDEDLNPSDTSFVLNVVANTDRAPIRLLRSRAWTAPGRSIPI